MAVMISISLKVMACVFAALRFWMVWAPEEVAELSSHRPDPERLGPKGRKGLLAIIGKTGPQPRVV
jgi:hypothetical protein